MTGRRRWPLLLIGSSAFVGVWSGWVGLGAMTGFGVVHPLPGIWDALTVDTAITLPIGVEAYAVYALAVATDPRPLTGLVRRYAWASAGASLVLGMAGQVAYHVMSAHGVTAAPWWVTAIVACLPVLVLGAAGLLWHLVAAADRAEAAREAERQEARERRRVTGQASGQAGHAPVTTSSTTSGTPARPGTVTPPVMPAVTPGTVTGSPGSGLGSGPGAGKARALDIDELVLPAQAVAVGLVRSGQKVTRAALAKGLRDEHGLSCSTDKAQALMPIVRERLTQQQRSA